MSSALCTHTHATASSSHFKLILDAALDEYLTNTGIDLSEHQLLNKLKGCDTADAVIDVLQGGTSLFNMFRNGNRKTQLLRGLKPTVNILLALSNCAPLVNGIGSVFPPAQAIFSAIDVLLSASKKISDNYDSLLNLFESMQRFLIRLKIYTSHETPFTESMVEILVKTMAELLTILALATKQIQQGRLRAYGRMLIGDNEVQDALQRLDKLTQEESLTVAAHTFGNVNKMMYDQMNKDIWTWLSPPDPSTNHNIARKLYHEGTAKWFIEGETFKEWKSQGSLLWLNGNAGSGKSILCSTIVEDVQRLRSARSAYLAYFYCDFRDKEKQNIRSLLSSLLIQFRSQSDAYRAIVSELYSKHDNGEKQPDEKVLAETLKAMLVIPVQDPMYIIIDALDECPLSGMPSKREEVSKLIKDLVDLRLPYLRICVTSRPEPDIQKAFTELAQHCVSLHAESGQTRDISEYIYSTVNTDPMMSVWEAERKELVIKALSEKANGMFRWVFCQLETLRHCQQRNFSSMLESLPKTLDETYEATLRRIKDNDWKFAHRLFQCLAFSARPLRVEEVATMLEFDFDAGHMPKHDVTWRNPDSNGAVLSTCSSLVIIVNHVDDRGKETRVVQFAHFSVREFLTSDRLAGSMERRYHVLPKESHRVLAQTCLSTLLKFDKATDTNTIENFPLSRYAAKHWVDHARFEDVSLDIRNGMEILFDPDKTYFLVWIGIYDLDSYEEEGTKDTSVHPIYYAALCGFPGLVEYLGIKQPGSVNSRGGMYDTPLQAACVIGQMEMVKWLLDHGADVNAEGGYYGYALHAAASNGHLEMVKWLLDHGADVDAKTNDHGYALHVAARNGHLEIVKWLLDHGAYAYANGGRYRYALQAAASNGHLEIMKSLVDNGAYVNAGGGYYGCALQAAAHNGHLETVKWLLDHGAGVNDRGGSYGYALHAAASYGHLETVKWLLDHGADVNAWGGYYGYALQAAASNGNLEIVKWLLGHGAGVNAKGGHYGYALQGAAENGYLEIVKWLLDHGASVNAMDNDYGCALHAAASNGDLEIVKWLLDHGADVNAKGGRYRYALHVAASYGHLETVKWLLDHGADVNAKTNDDGYALHAAASDGHLEVVKWLLDHGADVNAEGGEYRYTLQAAASNGHLEIVKSLLDHGAGVNAKGGHYGYALHAAAYNGNLEIVKWLLDHGANVNAMDNDGGYALQTAARNGHLEIVKWLLDHGAGVNVMDNNYGYALHVAARNGHLEIVKWLLDHGADVNAMDNDDEYALHIAASNGHLEIVKSLLEHGADVNAMAGFYGYALQGAASNGNLEVVKWLLGHGADVNAKGGHYGYALQAAASNRHLEIVKSLLDHGADVNAMANDDGYALHVAARNGHLEIVKSLLEHGAYVNANGGDYGYALQAAASNGHLEIVKWLLDHGADVNAEGGVYGYALHAAASNENWEIKKWLIEHGARINV